MLFLTTGIDEHILFLLWKSEVFKRSSMLGNFRIQHYETIQVLFPLFAKQKITFQSCNLLFSSHLQLFNNIVKGNES